MKMRRNAILSAAAFAATAAAAPALAGPLFTFEDSETVTVTTPNNGTFTWLGGIADVNTAYQRVDGALTRFEPTDGYVWGQSWESDSDHAGLPGLVDHTRSTVGATDGSYSMRIHDPTGGFKWGTQVLFNNETDPRFIELTTATKLLIDVSTPGGDPGLPEYQTTYGGVNFAAGFLSSYEPAAVGNYHQFVSGPATQTELSTQTYMYDIGGQMIVGAGSLWPGLTNYVILHFSTGSPDGAASTFYYDNVRVINEDTATRPTWQTVNTANWTDAGSWANGVPNAVGAPAIFIGRGASNGTVAVSSTINVDSAITVGSIIFDAQVTTYAHVGASGAITSPDQLPAIVNYTLSGPGSLTFDVASGRSEIYALTGSHSINVPTTINDNLRIDTGAGFGADNNPSLPGGGRYSSAPRASLTIGSAVNLASGVTLTTAGAGTVGFGGPVSGGADTALQFNGGRVNIGANASVGSFSVAPAAHVTLTPGTSTLVRTNSLAVGDGTNNGVLDLTNNALVVDYAAAEPSPLGGIVALIEAGNQISKGLIATAGYAVGYAEASDLSTIPAIFGSVDGTAVLLRGTRAGDSNLDGLVNLSDFNALAANFGQSGRDWVRGDFNYDGLVNLSDFNRLAANFGLAAGVDGPTPQDWSNLAAAVPEPGVLGLAAVAGLPLFRRRRSR